MKKMVKPAVTRAAAHLQVTYNERRACSALEADLRREAIVMNHNKLRRLYRENGFRYS